MTRPILTAPTRITPALIALACTAALPLAAQTEAPTGPDTV